MEMNRSLAISQVCIMFIIKCLRLGRIQDSGRVQSRGLKASRQAQMLYNSIHPPAAITLE